MLCQSFLPAWRLSKKKSKRSGWKIRSPEAKAGEVISAKLTIGNRLQQPSSISYRYGAQPAHQLFFFLITQSLSVSRNCFVAYLARSIDPRCTQPECDAGVEQFLSCSFFDRLLSDKRGAEISQKLHQIVELMGRIEGHLQSWSSTALHCRSRLFAGEFSKIGCLLKQRLNCRRASIYCQETLSNCSWQDAKLKPFRKKSSDFDFVQLQEKSGPGFSEIGLNFLWILGGCGSTAQNFGTYNSLRLVRLAKIFSGRTVSWLLNILLSKKCCAR